MMSSFQDVTTEVYFNLNELNKTIQIYHINIMRWLKSMTHIILRLFCIYYISAFIIQVFALICHPSVCSFHYVYPPVGTFQSEPAVESLSAFINEMQRGDLRQP